MNTSKLIAMFFAATGFSGELTHAGQTEDSFPLVKVATDIVQLYRHQSLAGLIAIPIDETKWAALARDSDLGPFLKFKKPQTGLSLVLIVPLNSKKDSTYCIYFRGAEPFGVAAVKATETGKSTDKDIREAYKEITKDMVKTGKEELYFTNVSLRTDDDSPLPAVKILSGGGARSQ
jgi:hypothetical protein